MVGRKDELKEMEKKAVENMNAHKVEHPCPFCGQELPGGEDFVVTAKKVTLNLKDANRLAELNAKVERLKGKVVKSKTLLSEEVYNIADQHQFYNNSPGIDTEEGVLTWIDANNERQKTNIKVKPDVCQNLKKTVHDIGRLENLLRLATVEHQDFMLSLAEHYKWIHYPFDIRGGLFVEVSDEVRRQRDLQMQQLERELSRPLLKDEDDDKDK